MPRGRRPKVMNPYMPTLLRLHDRWSPDQIANAIVAAERNFRKPVAQYIVMELAKMPQLERVSVSNLREGLRILPADELGTDDEPTMGTCEACHSRPGTTVIETGRGAKVLCGRCYLEQKEYADARRARDEVHPDDEVPNEQTGG